LAEPRTEPRTAEPVACVDFGSTFTKAVLVDAATGELLAAASHPTTLATDVGNGLVANYHFPLTQAACETAAQAFFAQF